jgi:BTB/POZ domain
MRSEMIKVIVGDPSKIYHLHKSLICEKSRFFQRCAEGSFEEAATLEVLLPEDESATFEQLVTWLYTKKIETKSTLAMIKIYTLADKLLVEELQSYVVDRVRAHLSGCHVKPIHVRSCAAAAVPKSELLRFLVQQMAVSMVERTYVEFMADPEFLRMVTDHLEVAMELYQELEKAHKSKAERALRGVW